MRGHTLNEGDFRRGGLDLCNIEANVAPLKSTVERCSRRSIPSPVYIKLATEAYDEPGQKK